MGNLYLNDTTNPGIRLTVAKINVLFFAFAIPLIIMMGGCAKVGSPTGGPRDLTPPVVLESDPQNRSTQFASSEIEIEFDEFIQLSNLNDELLISPPLENRPTVRIRNKTLLIDLNNELIPNTTYTMNFGNSLVDNNEGNALAGFEFVFSTGNYIDSLAVTGKALSAFDQKPPVENEDTYIMMYENLGDSVPLQELPRYIGKVNQSGIFYIHNIHPDTFRILALKDVNGDFRYNPISDAIAFVDSFIMINTATVEEIHFISDTATTLNDTLQDQGEILQAVNISMYYFHELNSKVFLNNKSREAAERIFLTFTRPPYDTAKITPLNFTPAGQWYVAEYSDYLDTITCWLTDTMVSNLDTITLEVSYTTTDLLDQFTLQKDTVQLLFRRTGEAVRSRARPLQGQPVVTEQYLAIESNFTTNQTVKPNSVIRFTAGNPIAEVNQNLFEFKKIEDSLELDHPIAITRDTLSIRSFSVSIDWEEESQYRLILLPGAVADIYGLVNDSLIMQPGTLSSDFYGNIRLTVQGEYFPLIVQLMDENDRIIRIAYMDQSGLAEFNYMEPGRYSIKAIHDLNENKKWDTGNYLKQMQPEKVFFYNIPDEIRSSWDYDYTWLITE